MTHKDLDKMLEIAEKTMENGRDLFNMNNLPYEERQIGLNLIEEGEEIRRQVGALRSVVDSNNRSQKKEIK